MYAAVTHMLFRVLERMTWGDTIETEGHVPWLPEFVPKIGLEVIKYWFLGFSASFGAKCGRDSKGESFMKELVYLRQKDDIEMSLASTCCLNGMVKIITTIDNLILSAKAGICSLPRQEQSLSKEGKVLEDGIDYIFKCIIFPYTLHSYIKVSLSKKKNEFSSYLCVHLCQW